MKQIKKIRILIADDHAVVRSGLRALFKSTPDILVVGEAVDGEQTIDFVEKRRPDVVLVDISMPKLNGIETTRIIKEKYPSTSVLILTIYDENEYIHQMIRAGADGYILKSGDKKDLFTAVRTIAKGGRYFGPMISERIIDEYIKQIIEPSNTQLHASINLTRREIEILQHIAQGFTSKKIAEKLFLSIRTINTHRANLMQKLNIHDTAGLVRYAIENRLIDLSK